MHGPYNSPHWILLLISFILAIIAIIVTLPRRTSVVTTTAVGTPTPVVAALVVPWGPISWAFFVVAWLFLGVA